LTAITLRARKGDGYPLQLSYREPDVETGEMALQRARKWYVSPWMTETEIVETAFKACRVSSDHVLKEHPGMRRAPLRLQTGRARLDVRVPMLLLRQTPRVLSPDRRGPLPGPSETGDCNNADLVLYSGGAWTGDKLCLAGVGEYDLSALTHPDCNNDGDCTDVPWSNTIRSFTSKRAGGTIFARKDGAELSKDFSASEWEDWYSAGPGGTTPWLDVLTLSYKVSITSVQ
jgi:hypothetical protein